LPAAVVARSAREAGVVTHALRRDLLIADGYVPYNFVVVAELDWRSSFWEFHGQSSLYLGNEWGVSKFEFCFFWTAVTCHRFALQCEALFGITATYIGSRIIGSKSKNTKAAMNRRTPKSAKLELRSGSNAALYSLGTPVSTIFCALNP
jgi:hypothetical protein